jgi:hypothetical protein
MEVVAALGSSLSLDLAGDLVELGSLTEGDHVDATGRSAQCPRSEHPWCACQGGVSLPPLP